MIHLWNPMWGFDFKIRFGKHIVNLVPGEQITVKFFVERLRGSGTVSLSANTQWEAAGLTAKVIPNLLSLDTQGWEAVIMIRASLDAKPGSYLFTVRGETRGTFHTSKDAVMVVVTDKKDRKRDEDEEDFSTDKKELARKEPSGSLDLDNLFAPKNAPKRGQDSPERKTAVGESDSYKPGPVFSVVMGLILASVIFMIVMAIVDGTSGGGRSYCPTSCGSSVGTGVPQSCPCPRDCPYTYIANTGNGMKECAVIRRR
ncbi:MAG: hypothetical protein WC878_07760 [Candidatus Paceibacterota bacterium]